MQRRTLRVACSPDADDLFMFRALWLGLVDDGGFDWDIRTDHTDALNRVASGDSDLDVCAVSTGFWPSIADRWQLLPHGGSVGDGYGPVVVAPGPLPSLEGLRVAIPGFTTTAWLVLKSLVQVEPVVIPITPHEAVFEALADGRVDAALLIHEGRLTYGARGLSLVMDLGVEWKARTGLPLPLGGNAIRRDLGPEVIRRASATIRASIAHALDHREEAMDWLMAKGGALDRPSLDRYLQMYANEETRGYSPAAVEGMRTLYRRAGLDLEPDFAP